MTKLKCTNKECNHEVEYHGEEPKKPTKTKRSKDYTCYLCGEKMSEVE